MISAQPAFKAVALSKAYGKRLAVDHLDLEVDRGELFGFLGPNGAGKTTTIRMALGLVAPTNGSVEILGQEVRRNRSKVLPRVGALVENPALYGYLSGRNNLRAFGDLLGGVSVKRIDEVLEIVSLKGREKDKVKTYSMGMKQRLGLAIALLNDPDLLILDEPANGLDPEGIFWMRELLRDFADRAGTVLLSSHLLREIEVIADQLVVIGDGKIIAQGTKAELLAGTGTLVRARDPEALYDGLVAEGLSVTQSPSGELVVDAEPEAVGLIAAELGCALIELRPADGGGLEQLFLSLTAREEVAA
jgi:ABC-2 type transport system ATP-binding protein